MMVSYSISQVKVNFNKNTLNNSSRWVQTVERREFSIEMRKRMEIKEKESTNKLLKILNTLKIDYFKDSKQNQSKHSGHKS